MGGGGGRRITGESWVRKRKIFRKQRIRMKRENT
jgi:hypothetical protein